VCGCRTTTHEYTSTPSSVTCRRRLTSPTSLLSFCFFATTPHAVPFSERGQVVAHWELFLLNAVGYHPHVRRAARDRLSAIEARDAAHLQALHQEVMTMVGSITLSDVPTPTPLPAPRPLEPPRVFGAFECVCVCGGGLFVCGAALFVLSGSNHCPSACSPGCVRGAGMFAQSSLSTASSCQLVPTVLP
jgi:hypothetical protein